MIPNRMFQLVMLLQATLPEFFVRSSAVASPETSLVGKPWLLSEEETNREIRTKFKGLAKDQVNVTRNAHVSTFSQYAKGFKRHSLYETGMFSCTPVQAQTSSV